MRNRFESGESPSRTGFSAFQGFVFSIGCGVDADGAGERLRRRQRRKALKYKAFPPVQKFLQGANSHWKLVNDAIDTINQYGDFEMFSADDTYSPEQKPKEDLSDFMNIPVDVDEEVPFDEDPLPFN